MYTNDLRRHLFIAANTFLYVVDAGAELACSDVFDTTSLQPALNQYMSPATVAVLMHSAVSPAVVSLPAAIVDGCSA